MPDDVGVLDYSSTDYDHMYVLVRKAVAVAAPPDPTQMELFMALGDPEFYVTENVIGIVDDSAASDYVYLCMSMGDGWFYAPFSVGG